MKPKMKEGQTKFVEAAKVDSNSNVCRQCGRVNRQIKTGSLTSWLFADNRCHCEKQQSEPTVPTYDLEDLVIEGFEVTSVIGSGGMGTVFKVKENCSGNVRAIKLMRGDLAQDPLSVKRFEQEVESCMALSHDYLPTVFSRARTADGRPYFVMDCLEGMTLQALLTKEGFLDSDRALSIFLKVAEALLYAHQNGIVHRDVKPSNIFILQNKDGKDDVKVLDFGIARVLRSEQSTTQSLTSTGEIFGSPLYMSPEQCRGEEVDTRSDIYSLGCVMYETLCGRPPFQGKNPVQTILKHLSDDEPEPLVSKKLGVSNTLQNLVFRCLAKQPAQRYNNFEELQRDLRLLISGAHVDIQRIKCKRQSRSKTIIVRLIQTCIICLFFLIAVMLWILNAFGLGDIKSLTLKIDGNPADWESYVARAALYHEAGRSSEAMTDLNRALQINPNSYWALNRRATIYQANGDYEKALADFSKAISISPNQRNCYINRAILFIDRGRYKDAINDCTEGLKYNPLNLSSDNLLTYVLRATAYVADGQYDLALADLDKAEALPRSLIDTSEAKRLREITQSLLITRAEALVGKHQYENALEAIDKALAIDPKSIEALRTRATVYIDLNEREKADADLCTMLDLDPDRKSTYVVRGTNRMFMGRMKEALEDLSISTNASPIEPNVYYERGYAYFVAGDYVNALKDFRKYIELGKVHNKNPFYGAVGAYFCNQLLNNHASDTYLAKAAAYLNVETDKWEVAVVKYLRNQISETEFRNASNQNHKFLSLANGYIGLKQYLNGNKKMAAESFKWVEEHGHKTNFEFAVARSMLKRIESER